MPSQSLQRWQTSQQAELDGFETALRGLSQVRLWRQSCSTLARHLDIVVGCHVTRMTGRRPW